jgi:hypothetical protein
LTFKLLGCLSCPPSAAASKPAESLPKKALTKHRSIDLKLFELITIGVHVTLRDREELKPTVAVAWQRASAGDWAAYAAEVSRRARKDDHQ